MVQRTRNPRLKTRIVAMIDESGLYGMESIIFVAPKVESSPTHYLLGILNSSLINYVYATKFLNVAVKAEYLKDTPIPRADSLRQNRVVEVVKNILRAKQRDAEADVSALEREIDQLVYALYGLTPEEIQIVESAAR